MTMARRSALAGGAVLGVIGLILLARGAADVPTLGDIAVIESYTWMAAKGQLLYGPYSRFQWHHPGPLAFFCLAPFYVLAGAKPAGLSVGALVLNLTALALATAVIVRRAGNILAMAIALSIGWYAWRVAPVLTSAWNPHVPVFPLIALIIVAADAMTGTAMSLPVVAILASLVAQTHIALLPSALAIGIVSFAAVLAGSGTQPPSALRKRSLILTVIALLLLWALPVAEEIAGRPGNITQIWTFFVSTPHRGQRFANALYAWEDMLTGLVRPGFDVARGLRFRQRSIPWVESLAILQMVGVAATGVLALGARRRFEAALAGLLLTVSLLALWSATRIEETIFDHEVFWISALGTLNIALLVTLVVRPLSERARSWPTPGISAAACWTLFAICAAVGIGEMRSVVANASNTTDGSDAVSAVATDLRAYFDREHIARPLIRIDQDAWPLAAGVIVRLQKEGVPVAVEDDWLPMFTPAFASTGREEVALAITGKPQHVRTVGKPGDVVVIDHDPLLFVHRQTR